MQKYKIEAMLRNIAVLPLVLSLAMLTACSSSSRSEETPSDTGGEDSAQLSAQDLLETCVTTDVPDFAALLEVIQNLLNENADLPQPELDLLRLLIDGTVGYSLDVDQDGTIDIAGAFGFTDQAGNATIPIDAQTIQDILAGGDVDLQAILDGLPEGTTFNLEFELPNLPGAVLAGDAPAGGAVSFSLGGDGVTTVSGGGEFRSGDCAFGFDFSDIGDLNGGLDGFPVASLGFDLSVGSEVLDGSIALDGTNRALIRAIRGDNPPEFFDLDLENGALSPADG